MTKKYSILRQLNKTELHSTDFKNYSRRVVLSGNILEVYDYAKPIIIRPQRRIGRSCTNETSDEQKQENRIKTANRARTKIKRTANANSDILNKFLTLTFAENITDLDYAEYEFEKFIKRLGFHFRTKILYIKVVEFQKRGAIHFHVLCNLPYAEVGVIARIWSHGFVKINRIDNVDNIGAYITKYMSKDNIDDRLAGRKCYSMSRGLKQPTILTNERHINELLDEVENVKRTYTAEFESEYYGTVTYTQIVCNAPIPIKKKWQKQILFPVNDFPSLSKNMTEEKKNAIIERLRPPQYKKIPIHEYEPDDLPEPLPPEQLNAFDYLPNSLAHRKAWEA